MFKNPDFDFLTTAKKLITDNLCCNSCLGRQFGNVLFGFTNFERGRIIKVSLLINWEISHRLNSEDILFPKSFLTKDFPEGIKTIDRFISDVEIIDEPCEVCNDLLIVENVERIGLKALKELAKIDFNTFLVGSFFPPEIIDKEEQLRSLYNIEWGESIKSEFNRKLGKFLGQKLELEGKEVEFNNPDLVIVANHVLNDFVIKINPLFIAGKYKKFSRGIPQSRWFCRKCRGKGCDYCSGTGKMYQNSVEEYISKPLLEITKGTSAKFHGSGREDIDARMLGTGRPFVIEVAEPIFRKIDLEKLQGRINEEASGNVEIEFSDFSDRSHVREIKTKSSRNAKLYSAIVILEESFSFTDEKIKEISDFLTGKVINQRTPNRVSHRRADKIRLRKVLEFSFTRIIDDKSIEIQVKSEGGLYIKELVSGDDGRTNPNLSDILNIKAKIDALDVLAVFSSPDGKSEK